MEVRVDMVPVSLKRLLYGSLATVAKGRESRVEV